MVTAICGAHFKDSNRAYELMQMLDFNETIYQLVMANSVCCHGHVLEGG